MAYASHYIPGVPSRENIEFGRLAVKEYEDILAEDSSNLSAIDGIAGILYSIASNPFDREKMKESKPNQQKHVEIRPNDPEPYFWMGVIEWSIAYRTELQIREALAEAISDPDAPANPLPEAARTDFEGSCGETVDEGIARLRKPISLKPNYPDAMAYLKLLYRLKADVESSEKGREIDLRMATDLVDQVKAIKEKRASEQIQQ